MAGECEFLERCGLFTKYQSANSVACEWFIGQYCSGFGTAECRRKRFYRKHGVLPSDDMLPSGSTLIVESKDINLS